MVCFISNYLDSDFGHSHPMLSWDCMPASGGSQLHTHMHGFVGRGHKLGHFRGHEEARKSYERKHRKSDLTQDYINVHIALGLGLRLHGGDFFSYDFFTKKKQAQFYFTLLF